MVAERFQQAAAAEIMGSAGNKIIRKTVSGIEMCCVRLIGCIDSNEYALTVKISLNDALLIRQNRNLEITVAERFAGTVCMRQFADQMMQVFKGNRQTESIHDEGGDLAAEAGGIMTRHQRK